MSYEGLSNEELLEKAKRCFKRAVEAEASQRERERADLLFQIPEEQWSAEAKRQRMGDALTPGRPMLSISKLDQPIQLVLNQARAAKMGVTIRPIGRDSNEQTAEALQGLYRRIEQDSKAHEARLWALDRATKVGRGVYRITRKWDEDADPTSFDQEIVIEPIEFQDSVYFDPAATKPDYSDAEWVMVLAWHDKDQYEKLHPQSKIVNASDIEFEGFTQEAPEWIVEEKDGNRRILVAEYWYKEHKVEVIKRGNRSRERDLVQVYHCKLTGAEVIEEPQLWDGKYLPFVFVRGRKLQPVDGERRYVGMISHAKDAQQLHNYMISSVVEEVATQSKAPYVGYEGQFEGHEDKWRQANVRNYPYLEVKPMTIGGAPAPFPQRMQVDGMKMQTALMVLDKSDQLIQSTTFVYDPSLGRVSQKERSGKAILASQSQSDAGTSDFLACLADAIDYEARVILDLIPSTYDTAGRITQILRGDDDKSEMVMLNMPYRMEGGRPVPAQSMSDGAKLYDFRKGRYAVSIQVGKSFQTALQEGDEALTQIVSAKPELLPIIGDIWFAHRTHPGAKEISKRLARWREMQFPGLGEGEDGQISPEAIQAQNQALKGQLQEAQQQLQLAAQEIQTERAKQEATMLKAQVDSETKLAVAKIDQLTELLKAQIAGQQEAAKQALEQAHETQENSREMAHEVAMAAAGGQSMTFSREGGRDSEDEFGDERISGQSSERTDEAEKRPEGDNG